MPKNTPDRKVISISNANSATRAIRYYRQEIKDEIINKYYSYVMWANTGKHITGEDSETFCLGLGCKGSQEKAEYILESNPVSLHHIDGTDCQLNQAFEKTPEIKNELEDFINHYRKKGYQALCKAHFNVHKNSY